jgi:hypothetical protein
MLRTTITALTIVVTAAAAFAVTADFEDLGLAPGQFYNGSDGAGQFVSNGFTFDNNYNASFGSWDGFAASATTDITTPGFTNQYSAIAGGGLGGSETYGVGYYPTFYNAPPRIDLPGDLAHTMRGMYVTNTTYTYLTLRDGDMFTQPFGEDDLFTLTVWGLDAAGDRTGASVEAILADGRDILDDWTWVNLAPLGHVYGLEFSMDSTDTGQFGINTPTYFAVDNVAAVPEPVTLIGLTAGLGGLAGYIRRRRAGR